MKQRLCIGLAGIILITALASLNFRKNKKAIRSLSPPITMCGTFFNALEDTSYLPIKLYEGLGELQYPISTKNQVAQKFFDQGLRLIYAYNHMEALRSFREASRLEPTCAMCYWGQALALGPNLNEWNPKDRESMAFEAINKAKKFASVPREIDFIQALAARYNGKAYEVRDSLNNAYRLAMKKLSEKYPADPEASTFYADAIMTSIPWNYWKSDGTPRQFISDARTALETVMKKFPLHPGAHHLYIHLVEASRSPGDALKSAAFLETAMPSAGHIVHMPSHVYVRVGEYNRANVSNTQAVKVDEEFLAQTDDQGFYRIGYYPHNIDFLAYGSLMNGQSNEALKNSDKLVYQLRPMRSAMPGFYDFFQGMPVTSLLRFGKWNEILALPAPDPGDYQTAAFQHFARGTAFLRKGKPLEAWREVKRLDSINRLDTLKNIHVVYNSTFQLTDIAAHVLRGEYLVSQNKWEEGLKSLKDAVMAEDTLRYNEPPDWRLPTRHFLGAALLEAGRFAEAEKVYEEDLVKNPENGWSLQGLWQAQKKQGKVSHAGATAARFEKAWKNADVKISSSRF